MQVRRTSGPMKKTNGKKGEENEERKGIGLIARSSCTSPAGVHSCLPAKCAGCVTMLPRLATHPTRVFPGVLLQRVGSSSRACFMFLGRSADPETVLCLLDVGKGTSGP